jgi:F0F1-type ATP synthase assembly protein I
VTPDQRGPEREDWGRALREVAPYVGIGTTLAVTVLLGLGIGYWMDGRLGTRPLFFILGGTFGLVAALVYFFRTVSSLKR